MQATGLAVQSATVFETSYSTSQGDGICPGFEEMAMPLFGSLYNFARWITRDPHDAEDLVQETYLKALRAFASFRPGSNLRAWMFKILKHTYLNSRCKLERRMTVNVDPDDDMSELAADHETPYTILAKSSDSDELRRAIGNLPKHFREVLLLCEVEDMSYQEIAEALSIPIGTVMSRLSRARRMLRANDTEHGQRSATPRGARDCMRTV
jgi:RNA polymerase sigma-70 factor (ECF subfamily)